MAMNYLKGTFLNLTFFAQVVEGGNIVLQKVGYPGLLESGEILNNALAITPQDPVLNQGTLVKDIAGNLYISDNVSHAHDSSPLLLLIDSSNNPSNGTIRTNWSSLNGPYTVWISYGSVSIA